MRTTSQSKPKYQQIKDYIISHIHDGVWKNGDGRVPSEHELVKQFGISRMTANRALRELASEGYVVRVKGLGTFVARRKASSHLLEICDISEEVRLRGNAYSGAVVMVCAQKVSGSLERMMEMDAGARVYYSRIVHYENEEPIQLEDRYVNAAVVPAYEHADFTVQTPSGYLSEVAPLEQVEHVVQAVMPNRETVRLLKMGKVDEPCLLVQRRTWSQGVVVSYAELLHPGSRYELAGKFRPRQSSSMPGSESR